MISIKGSLCAKHPSAIALKVSLHSLTLPCASLWLQVRQWNQVEASAILTAQKRSRGNAVLGVVTTQAPIKFPAKSALAGLMGARRKGIMPTMSFHDSEYNPIFYNRQ